MNAADFEAELFGVEFDGGGDGERLKFRDDFPGRGGRMGHFGVVEDWLAARQCRG